MMYPQIISSRFLILSQKPYTVKLQLGTTRMCQTWSKMHASAKWQWDCLPLHCRKQEEYTSPSDGG